MGEHCTIKRDLNVIKFAVVVALFLCVNFASIVSASDRYIGTPIRVSTSLTIEGNTIERYLDRSSRD